MINSDPKVSQSATSDNPVSLDARDQIAISVANALIQHINPNAINEEKGEVAIRRIANLSYRVADAMLARKARGKDITHWQKV